MPKKKTSKKGAGGNLTRSETVTIRLDPKMRYLTEIAARSQRRTVSSFIEWAIEQSFTYVRVTEGGGINHPNLVALSEQSELLWRVHEADRFAYLLILHIELLNSREQFLRQLIVDRGLMSEVFPEPSSYDLNEGIFKQVNWKQVEQVLVPALRKHWEQFNAVVDGELDVEKLPMWG